ncbi:uncharacterized protein TrAtP1_003064 [Trichoderma atroviride]|uniref:uncharacterized protein n=1 Tax=Hypocrea atroviridis TaxID=63577 RepID=UPI00331CB8F2|nr:hypothetical protein TrAtP1_003064 [Trichoderma atroviride]
MSFEVYPLSPPVSADLPTSLRLGAKPSPQLPVPEHHAHYSSAKQVDSSGSNALYSQQP